MENKAENVVRNIGVLAETTSVFYNALIKQVPKDVALVLTQHFMDLTITRPTATPAQMAQAAALAEVYLKKRRTSPSPPSSTQEPFSNTENPAPPAPATD